MRSIGRSARGAALGVFAGFVLALSACDRGGGENEPGAGQSTPAVTKTKPKDPLADMVSAVSGGKPTAPVELKFALRDRPEVGKPVDVEVAVLPVSKLDRVGASFHAGTGLELRSGEQMAAVTRPEPGAPIIHRLTIVPQRDGIFFVSAVVSVDSPEQSLTRTFSIPIIAAQGRLQPERGSATPRPEPESR